MALRLDEGFELSDITQEESGFFNAKYIDGKYQPSYDSKQFSEYFSLFVGNGVFMSPADQLMVKEIPDVQGLSILVEPGWAFINGRWYHNKRQLVLEVPRNDGIAARKDGVFVVYDIANDTISTKYVQGRSTPQRTDLTYELMLAQIDLPQGSTQVTNSIITDKRGDSSVCGFVKGLLEVVDLEELTAQIKSFFDDWMETKDTEYIEYIAEKDLQFNEWLETIKGILDGDVAANLAREIADLKSKVQQLDVDINEISTNLELKADKSVLLSATITSSLWFGNKAPYTAILPVEQVTGNSNELLEVFLPDTNTAQQVTAWAECGILTAINTQGSITFKAYYDKPTVDIPIHILVKGDLGSKYPGGDEGGTGVQIDRITEQEVKNLFLDQNNMGNEVIVEEW